MRITIFKEGKKEYINVSFWSILKAHFLVSMFYIAGYFGLLILIGFLATLVLFM